MKRADERRRAVAVDAQEHRAHADVEAGGREPERHEEEDEEPERPRPRQDRKECGNEEGRGGKPAMHANPIHPAAASRRTGQVAERPRRENDANRRKADADLRGERAERRADGAAENADERVGGEVGGG